VLSIHHFLSLPSGVSAIGRFVVGGMPAMPAITPPGVLFNVDRADPVFLQCSGIE